VAFQQTLRPVAVRFVDQSRILGVFFGGLAELQLDLSLELVDERVEDFAVRKDVVRSETDLSAVAELA